MHPTRSPANVNAQVEPARLRPFAGMRTRVLLSFLVLLIVSTAASVIVLREVLISRIDDEVAEALADDIDELQDALRGTGRPGHG